MDATHTIIGAHGAIGTPLAKLLISEGKKVRLLSRSGKPSQGAESLAVDVFDFSSLSGALKGSSVAYLLVGLDYNAKLWADKWPILMGNVLDACEKENVPLIFFDNVYMYGKVEGKMTEDTPFNPCSKKGETRAKVAQMLLDAAQSGKVTASIARSADFYGPYADEKSMFFQTVLKNLAAGKKAQWLGDPTQPHSMSYTIDCARSLQILAETPDSFGQTWHVPTFAPVLSPIELAKLSSEIMNKPYRGITPAPKFLVRLLGLFMPIMREMVEMMYQTDSPYWFDSSKFEQRFGYQPTSYEQGISETVEHFGLGKK